MKEVGRTGNSMDKECITISRGEEKKESGMMGSECAGSTKIPTPNTNKFILLFIEQFFK